MRKLVVAIVSPDKDKYSETFVRAHRGMIDAHVRFYHEGSLPRCLDGYGPLRSNRIPTVIRQRLRRKLLYPRLSVDQLAFLDSLLRESVEVVFAEYGPTGVAVLPVCRQLEIPLVVHFHGYDASLQTVLKTYERGYQELFDFAAYVIVVSRPMEQRLLDMGCPRNKLIYNVYGPDDKFFDIERRNPSLPRFVAVGRFVDKKAPYYTILAFQQVLDRFPNAELLVAGEGPLWAACSAIVRYYGMQDNVTLPGVMTPDQVRQEYGLCTAFVQHSVVGPDGDMEGTPVAVLEAAAAGLPIIATRHAGIPDVVIDGETGFLVDEHDVSGMAHHMRRLLENPGEARRMGEAGRRRTLEQFTMKRHIDKLNDCVRKATTGAEHARQRRVERW